MKRKRKKPPKAKRDSSAEIQKPDRPAERRRPTPLSSQKGEEPIIPIVGIGASAGGLEAFTKLLNKIPPDTGLGFVLVPHLDPERESALAQILGRDSSLPVCEANNMMRVEADHVYIIAPNTSMSLAQGRLQLEPRQPDGHQQRTIDVFFNSLAHEQRDRAMGVILSGTASDGTMGLEAIKAEGGITFAQDESAKYNSMPSNAIASGCVDFVLPPDDIAKELVRIAKHLNSHEVPGIGGFNGDVESGAVQQERADATRPTGEEGRSRRIPMGTRLGAEAGGADRTSGNDAGNGSNTILLLLRKHAGVDFSQYKPNTIQRRIARRMVLRGHRTLRDYHSFLQDNPKELDALYADILISVTSFFRNQDTFDTLARRIIPDLIGQRDDKPCRVWVPGCSTGQEAYSIAMTFMEAMDQAPHPRRIQIFATDLNENLLETARRGSYLKALVHDVSPERLRRFFRQQDGHYRVIKTLRDMVIFARQNLFADPPFSQIDLISCRNVLIYLEPSLQKRAISTFHYALNPGGYLLLGASESIGSVTNLFEPVDRKHKLYLKKAAPTSAYHFPVPRSHGERREADQSRQGARLLPTGGEPGRSDMFHGELNVQREADRIMITRFAPPAVLIDAGCQILQFRGATDAYLEPPRGRASFDLLKMAREGLMAPLRAAINQVKKDNAVAHRDHVRVQQNGRTRMVNVKVVPLKHVKERCFLVVFEDVAEAPGPARPSRAAKAPRPSARESRRLAELEQDFTDTREYLQSIQEQHEAANEELQASNEEVQSANEELQSLNEELETSKEELESANEELTTVNEEMANRNAELTRLNADWLNLQNSITLPVVVLGRDLIIRRFSAQAETLFGLRGTDVGRPIASIRHNLMWDEREGGRAEQQEPGIMAGSECHAFEAGDVPLDVESVTAEVIATVRAREFEVCSAGNTWHLMRVRPYLTLDNKVDGAVLVLTEITDLKRCQREADRARVYAEAIIETGREPLLVLDGALRVERANRAFYRTFEVLPAETIGHPLHELGNHQWDSPDLRGLLEDIVSRGSRLVDFEITRYFERLGLRTMLLNASQLEADVSGSSSRILLAVEDITLRRRSENQLRMLTNELTLAEQRERRRVASELHDYLAQLLALGMIKLTQVKQQTGATPTLEVIDDLTMLLDQALTYTRSLVAQLSPPILNMFGLSTALKWLAEQMQPRGLFLTVEVEDLSLSFSEDHALLLFHSVRELLLNVVKHAGTKHAKLAMTTTEGTLRIRVSDEGVGFDVAAAMSPSAADEQTSPVPCFGLFSIRERMSAMGGRFELVSRPGEGTQAILIVPLPSKEHSESSGHDLSRERTQESPHSSGTASKAAEDASHAKKPIRILLVDDHAMVREGLRTMLEGYEDMEVVGEAGDGVQAVEAIDRCRPTVVVMDINMPNMNGIDATVQIKTRDPDVVVIGLSVQANAIAHEEMLRAGAATLISKEVAVEELHQTIRRILKAPLS
jgi:two-component system, chemotaxis family, CheB/CheR fusion protein